MASTSSSGTSSALYTIGGPAQKVPDPSNPASNSLASIYPSINAVYIPLVFGTLAYKFYLPIGAFIKEIMFSPNIGFSAGATLSMGTSAPGSSDLLSAIDLTIGSLNTVVNPILTGTLQTVFVTIGGAPAVGAGALVLSYFPTQKAPLAN